MAELTKKIVQDINEAISARDAEIALLKEQLSAVSDFKPTSACINALPDSIRQYIHDLETRCDPAGDIQTMASLKDQRDALAKQLSESQAETASVHGKR